MKELFHLYDRSSSTSGLQVAREVADGMYQLMYVNYLHLTTFYLPEDFRQHVV
jgi:hypothetical protein